ncbi:MAG: asparaginase [Acidimicrobiia bacterium]
MPPLRIRTVRSGLTEAVHEATVVASDAAGRVLAAWGEPDLPIFFRSAIKPFQATVAVEAGAMLAAELLAVACSSHSGFPIHRAFVTAILDEAGLGIDALRCPAAWPLAEDARDLLVAAGRRRPHPLFHNCSGKHAAWLAACRAAGWPEDTYLDPAHPLQRRVRDAVADVTGLDPEPVGVDGCGAPTLRGTPHGLARAFARLTADARFAAAATAMHRYPALVADHRRGDGRLGAWWGGPVKVGAQGLIAAGRHGVGIAAKSHEGSSGVAVVALMEGMRRLAWLPQVACDALGDVARPPVWGGGRVVGSLEPEQAG